MVNLPSSRLICFLGGYNWSCWKKFVWNSKSKSLNLVFKYSAVTFCRNYSALCWNRILHIFSTYFGTIDWCEFFWRCGMGNFLCDEFVLCFRGSRILVDLGWYSGFSFFVIRFLLTRLRSRSCNDKHSEFFRLLGTKTILKSDNEVEPCLKWSY